MATKSTELKVQRFLAKVARSWIPGVSDAAEFYSDFVAPKLASRGHWFIRLCLDEIFAIEDERLSTIEAVIQSDEFAAFVYQASQQAALTQSDEKIAALRNAVVNIALGADPGEDRRLIFLRAVSEFTPTHLRLLKIMQDPCDFVEKTGVETAPSPLIMEQVLQIAFPDFLDNEDFYKLIHHELGQRGFVPERVNSGTFMMQSDKITTPFGDAFLAFIESNTGAPMDRDK